MNDGERIGKNMESGGDEEERVSQIIGHGLGYVGLEKMKVWNRGDGTETSAWDRELGVGIKEVACERRSTPPCLTSHQRCFKGSILSGSSTMMNIIYKVCMTMS